MPDTKQSCFERAKNLYEARSKMRVDLPAWEELSEQKRNDVVIDLLIREKDALATGLIEKTSQVGGLEWAVAQRIHMASHIEEVLAPFISFAHAFVERDPETGGGQWANGEHKQAIYVWFGPSDFAPLLSFEDPNAEDRNIPAPGR